MASTIKLQGIYTQQKGTPAKKLKVGDGIMGINQKLERYTLARQGKQLLLCWKVLKVET